MNRLRCRSDGITPAAARARSYGSYFLFTKMNFPTESSQGRTASKETANTFSSKRGLMKAETADLTYSSLLLNFTCRSWGGLPGAEGSEPVDIQIGTNPRKAAILLKFSRHFKRFPNKTFRIKLCPEWNTLSPSAGIFFLGGWGGGANKATKSHICFKQIPLHHSFSLEVFTLTVLICCHAPAHQCKQEIQQ